MAPIATHTITSSDCEPAGFIFPDLLNDFRYPLRVNPNSHHVSRASEEWLFTEAHIVEPEISKFRALRIDYMNWIFISDDYLDDCGVDAVRATHECCISALRDPINFQTENPVGKICKSFFSRFTETASSGCTKRFIHAFDLILIAAAKEVDNRAKGLIPDLESYTILRRNVSGCKYCFALFEYTAQINLPDEVASHPVIMAMEDVANDYASWCNDICSYNKEQSCNDTNTNVIAVVMREQGLDLQGAVDYSGQLCKSAIQRFEDNHAILPSWGEEVDRQVAIYIQGMQDLIVTTLHWSFNSVRYFGKDELTVKQNRFIKLLPKRPL